MFLLSKSPFFVDLPHLGPLDSGPRSLLLASERLDPNCRDDRGDTALHLAAGNGERGACELLLKHHRVDRSLQDEDGRTVDWIRKMAMDLDDFKDDVSHRSMYGIYIYMLTFGVY